MSRRWRRALLLLYPSRFRHRYRDELLDLQDELGREGDLSRARATRDAITGAFIARSVGQRAVVVGSGLLIAALIATAATLASSGQHSRAVSRAQLAAVVVTPARPTVPYGRSCFVGAGTSCSPRACAEYTTSTQAPATFTAATQALEKRGTRRAALTCVNDPHASQPRGRSVLVKSTEPTRSTEQTKARPIRVHASATLASTGS